MKLLLSLLLIIIFNYTAICQEGLTYINTRIGSDLASPKQIIPIVDKKTNKWSVLLKYKKLSKVLLYDENQNVLSDFNSDIFTNEATNYIGSSILDSKYSLFFKNSNNSKFERLLIDFKTKSFDVQKIDLNIKKHYFIDSFEDNNVIYLLSIEKDSSILRIHELDFNGKVQEKAFDLSQESFKKFNGLDASLYYLITTNQNPSKPQSSAINYNVPNALEITSAVNKVYFKDGIVSITNDNVSSHTDLIQINIKDGSYKYHQISKKGFLKEELRTESNSFILDNYFLNCYVTTDKMVFGVYDLKTKSFIRELTINQKDSISFKNTPIINFYGKRTKYKDTNKSAQFLRDIINSNIGVSAYKKNDLIVVSIGASKKEKSVGFAIAGVVLGGIAGAILLSTLDSYVRTNSTKVDCLFDKNFNHVEGEVSQNGFDKIKTYIDTEKLHNASLQTVFRYKDDYIWGYYYGGTGTYKLFKFHQ